MTSELPKSKYNIDNESQFDKYQQALTTLFPQTKQEVRTQIKDMYYTLLHHFTNDSDRISSQLDGMNDAQLIFYLGDPYNKDFANKASQFFKNGRNIFSDFFANILYFSSNINPKKTIYIKFERGTNLLHILPKKPDVAPECDRFYISTVEACLRDKANFTVVLDCTNLETILLRCWSIDRMIYIEEQKYYLITAHNAVWKLYEDNENNLVGIYKYDDLYLDIDDGFVQKCSDPYSYPPYSKDGVPKVFTEAFEQWQTKFKNGIIEPVF